MKNYFIAAALLVSTMSVAQQRDSTQAPGGRAGMPGMAGMAGLGGARTAPKPYKEVITAKAVSQKGLFTVHKVDDKFYFEIPNSLLGREILAVTRYIKVPAVSGGGRGVYGGEIANQQTMTFEKGPSSNIFLRGIALISTANPTDEIYKAVTNSNLNAIAAAFPIAAFSKDHPDHSCGQN